MKKITELNAKYDGNQIARLVNYVNGVPLSLPDDQEYFVSLDEDTIHVYGTTKGIDKYAFNQQNSVYKLNSLEHAESGIQLMFNPSSGIEKIVLHKKPNKNLEAKLRPKVNTKVSSIFEKAGYKRSNAYASSGESRSSGGYGESRTSSFASSGESRSSSSCGESRGSSFSNYNKRSSSGGESRSFGGSGESRWW